MGSKNLKAVVVFGSHSITYADEPGFMRFNREVLRKFKKTAKENPPALRIHGTAVTVMATQNRGVLPTRNFQKGTFEN